MTHNPNPLEALRELPLPEATMQRAVEIAGHLSVHAATAMIGELKAAYQKSALRTLDHATTMADDFESTLSAMEAESQKTGHAVEQSQHDSEMNAAESDLLQTP